MLPRQKLSPSLISLVESNSKIGGQRTLAIVLMGVSGKQLQPSNCPGQYLPATEIGKKGGKKWQSSNLIVTCDI